MPRIGRAESPSLPQGSRRSRRPRPRATRASAIWCAQTSNVLLNIFRRRTGLRLVAPIVAALVVITLRIGCAVRAVQDDAEQTFARQRLKHAVECAVARAPGAHDQERAGGAID